MIRAFITVSMVLAVPVVAAPVDSSELARCHAMATRDQQLDCYEALAAAAASGATPAPVASTAPGSGARSAASASEAPAAPASASASAPTGSAAPTALASAPGAVTTPGEHPATPFNPDDPANFGLTRRQAEPHPSVPSAPSTPTALKSTVFQMTEDRLHNVTVVLDNGQTWKFIDPDPRLRPGDAVTIKRASLGSFLMLTPSRRSYRVERSK